MPKWSQITQTSLWVAWLIRDGDLDLKLRIRHYKSAARPVPREVSVVAGGSLAPPSNSEQTLIHIEQGRCFKTTQCEYLHLF